MTAPDAEVASYEGGLRVLLLNPPGRRHYQRDTLCSSVAKGGYSLPPGDLIAVSGLLGRKFQVQGLDALVEGIGSSQLWKHLNPGDHDVIIVQTSSASWEEDREILAHLSDWPCRLVVNGDYSLAHAAEVLDDDHFRVDAVILDLFDCDLAPFLQRSKAVFSGLACRGQEPLQPRSKGGKTRFHMRPRHDCFPFRRYRVPWALRRPVTTVYSAFGCPKKCRFCLSAEVPFRWRPTDEVLSELAGIREQGIREVVFYDPLFTRPRKRVEEICKGIEREGLDLTWSCFTREDCLEDELALRMRRAGCHTVLVGIESGSDRVLDSMGKGQTTVDIRRGVRRLRRTGLRIGGLFMMGYPGETEEEIRQTIRFATQLGLAFASFQYVVPFDPTPLGREIRKWNPSKPFIGHDDAERPYPANREITLERLRQIRNSAYRSFYVRPSYILNRLVSLRTVDEFTSLAMDGWRLVTDSFFSLLSSSKSEDGT